jgi:hypothetical protein
MTITPITLKWRVGDRGVIDGRHIDRKPGVLYEARVLSVGTMPDPKGESEVYWEVDAVHLELTHSTPGFGGASITATWTHGKPVPAAYLRHNQYDREKKVVGRKARK